LHLHLPESGGFPKKSEKNSIKFAIKEKIGVPWGYVKTDAAGKLLPARKLHNFRLEKKHLKMESYMRKKVLSHVTRSLWFINRHWRFVKLESDLKVTRKSHRKPLGVTWKSCSS
jgi:hypothetical protein